MLAGSGGLEWIRPPRQDRSRQKLHRILDAAEKLLEKKTFEAISVAEIMREARASTGLFYTRFENKEALLEALYERHIEELETTSVELLDPERWRSTPVADVIEAIVRITVRLHARKRGLLRALVLRSYTTPHPRFEDPRNRAKTTLVRMGRLMESKSDEIGHPDPRFAGSFGFLMMLGAVREKLLFSHAVARALPISQGRMVRELTRNLLGYLQVPDAGNHRADQPPTSGFSHRGRS